jgi:osmotically-inducible protein OsmY
MPIKVSTKGGLVTLSGSINSQEKAAQAIKLAKSISGVTEVKSELIVTEKAKPATP